MSSLLCRFASVLLLLLASGCVTEGTGKSTTKADASPWLEPSPNLRLQIDERVERLPWTHGVERVELIRWFAIVGEPAYPTLLELAGDPRPDVAGAALAALGATGDARLVEPIRAIRWSYRLPRTVELERARALVRLGDWSEVPRLIDGLEDAELYTRALCAKTLFDLTQERFDYDARGTDAARADSVKRWRAWWSERSLDPVAQDERRSNEASAPR